MVDDADRASSAEPDPKTWDKPTRRTRDWLDTHFTRIPKMSNLKGISRLTYAPDFTT